MVKRTTIWAHPTNFYVGRLKKVKYIVIHSGETGEGSTPAEGMGNWFARDHGAGGRSSTHVGADTDSICRYVKDTDTAFGAPNVNATGFHVELAGRAGQTAAQWDDADSRLILANGALAAAEASQRLGIPAVWLTDDELRAGVKAGFITHAQASRVLGGTHWDPGSNFPAARFMTLVRSHLGGTSNTITPKEDEMSAAEVNELKAHIDKAIDRAIDYDGKVLVGGYTVGGKAFPGIAAVNIENQRRITALAAQVTSLSAAVKALAEAKGADSATILKAVEDAATKALSGLEITLTNKEG